MVGRAARATFACGALPARAALHALAPNCALRSPLAPSPRAIGGSLGGVI